MKFVPNQFPSLTSYSYRIAFVGEAPGSDETAMGRPFVGISGRLLTDLMSRASIVREACFIGNVCQVQPPANDLSKFDWNGPEIQSGIQQLITDFQTFRPHLVVCLGSTAFHLFKEGNVAPKLRKVKSSYQHSFPNSIDAWRGSLFISNPEFLTKGTFSIGFKCLATFHPAFCLRQFSATPLLMMDLKKAYSQGHSPNLVLPQRNLHTSLTADQICNELAQLEVKRLPVSCDIEGYWNNIWCCSFATSATDSFIVPFARADGSSYWPDIADEINVYKAMRSVLMNPAVPKVWQNGLYDRFCFQYGYNIPVFGNRDDTMLKFWEKYCELEKGLGSQCSILTDEPYYKFERKSDSQDTQYRYCCKDSAVTYELNDKLERLLDDNQKSHYSFNHTLLNCLLYMELRGIRYDKALAKEKLVEVNRHIYILQAQLDNLAGCGVGSMSRPNAIARLREECCFKRDQSTPKKAYAEVWSTVMSMMAYETLDDYAIGFINISCGLSMNIRSDEFKSFLYTTLGLPIQYNKKTDNETTDYLALLKLWKKTSHKAVELAIEIGSLRTRSQMLEIACDPDGRVRCGYNLVGTETGRITCYTSPTGSGYNLQTIPSKDTLKPPGHPLREGMRDLFIADEDCWLGQCDLSGADGWTVGAHMARLGDSTMLDDLYAKIKPAAVVCLILRKGYDFVSRLDRPSLKDALREVKSSDADYFFCKQGIWGTCYLMGPRKLADVVLCGSEGRIALSESEVREFQRCVFLRYRVKTWHDAMARHLSKSPTLSTSFGFTRRFFGRSTEILGQALAHEPQANTTYATNRAAFSLWMDKDNRLPGSALKVEPIHQVHDALLLQWKKSDTTWATGKIKSWFNNPINIAGRSIVIPFEGSYGSSWGSLEEGQIV